MSSTAPPTIKGNSKFSKVDKFTVPLSNSLALRIYSDTKPHNLHLTDLQKGMILVYKGVETVGEGTGFGVPVLLYPDETYFSGSSHVYLSRQNDDKIVCKEFLMDTVSRPTIGKTELENRNLRSISRYFDELYRSHRHMQPFLLLLAKKIGANTGFVKSTSAGKVLVTYSINKARVLVRIDFSLLRRKNLQKAFILNEQGSSFFSRYLDSNDTELIDKQIGTWDETKAEWGCITDLQGKVGFRLWRVKNSVLRRGRESLEDYLDWIGLDYEVNPKTSVFEYEIEIFGED